MTPEELMVGAAERDDLHGLLSFYRHPAPDPGLPPQTAAQTSNALQAYTGRAVWAASDNGTFRHHVHARRHFPI
jgi:hypothetical protein